MPEKNEKNYEELVKEAMGETSQEDTKEAKADISADIKDMHVDTSKFKPLAISDDDKNRFFACVLDDTPYTETIQIMKDRQVAVFATRTIEQTQKAMASLSSMKNVTIMEYEAARSIQFMATMLQRIEEIPSGRILVDFAHMSHEDRVRKLGSMTSPKYLQLLIANNLFENKVMDLSKLAQELFF